MVGLDLFFILHFYTPLNSYPNQKSNPYLWKRCAKIITMNNWLILHNIRSAQNVGALFRTAEACGIEKIYLTGYTPRPLDRFGRDQKSISKSALGAEKIIPWDESETITSVLKNLKKENFQIIAIEQSNESVDYKKVKTKDKNVFVLGNEVKGISKQTLDKCDVVAEIPMKGKKESLNVSVSGGIALFRILNI